MDSVKASFAFFFCLVVLLIDEDSALLFSRIGNLGTKNNITTTKVEIDLFHNEFVALAEGPSSDDIPDCEKFLVLKLKDVGMKFRNKPKGTCDSCCQLQPGDIKFLLFSKKLTKKPFVLPEVRKSRALYRNLNNKKKVIIYIHGFMEIPEIGSGEHLKNAYTSRNENYAVILVDWSELVSFPWYFDSITNVRHLAKMIAKFLETYSDDGVIDIGKVHLIGFSLGAHVAGFVGKYLRKDLRIPRITALDPAYPAFHDVSDEYKLIKTDADFVDVIHTDGGNFGFIAPVGDLDFYPNKGTYYQPGCGYKYLQKKQRMYDVFSCSHNMAHRYYVESVHSPRNFPAVKCVLDNDGEQICNDTDVAYMGFAATPDASGSYFLETNIEAPYGRILSDESSSSEEELIPYMKNR